MGYSFVDLDATSTTMKMELYLDTRLQDISIFVFKSTKKEKTMQRPTIRPPRVALGMISGGLQTHQVMPLFSTRCKAERPPLKDALFLVKMNNSKNSKK
jgi:hypothetical protein